MGLYSKVKYVAKVFIKTPGKVSLVKKSLRVLKNEGVSGLKRAIKATGQKQESIKDLYEKQQSVKRDYGEYEESVLYIIWAMQAEVDICDTYNLTRAQMKEQDHIVTFKSAEKAVWEDEIECEKFIYSAEGVKTSLQKLLKTCEQDYVYIIKAGNYLATNMRNEFAEMMRGGLASVIYSDEAVFDATDGHVIDYELYPEFSAYELYQGNQSWQSVMYAREILVNLLNKEVYTDSLENMQLDLMMYAAEKKALITHVEQVLLMKKDVLVEQNLTKQRTLVERHLKLRDVEANVIIEEGKLKICPYKQLGKTSIIVLAENEEDTKHCVETIVNNTANADYELIVADKEDLSYIQRCNKAAKKATGELLLFLQDDMRVQTTDWLAKLAGVFVFPEVGAVSPKILRADNTIRYAGMVAGGFGFTPIPFNGEVNQSVRGMNEPAFANRQISVLSASCLAVRRAVFEQVGGFDEANFTDKFSNAQISFEIARAGYVCVYCADSMLMSDSKKWYDSWYDKEHDSAYLHILKNYGEELSEDTCFTNSMKHQYLRGVPIDFRIYQKKNEISVEQKSVLMVSHDSLLGGATIAFQYAARALKKSGYVVIWLLEQEGPMLEELERDGIGYIVDSSFKGSDGWINYAKNFDLIVCSTIVLCPQVEKIKNLGEKVIWWVHEAKDYYAPEITDTFTRSNLENLNVWCGGKFAQKIFEQHFQGVHTEVMLYGVPDYAGDEVTGTVGCIDNPKNKMIFLSIGTIESRKGQDVLAEAIKKLDPEIREQSLFVFLGKVIQENVFAKVEEVVAKYPESVTLMKPVDRNTLMRMYKQSDVVLCTSREDPMPVFMTECMMQSKIAICSENTGTAGVLTDGKDGFIYHNDSEDELAEKITYVVQHKDEMQQIRVNARETYEQNFSMEIFEEKVRKQVAKILEE